jgi:hypothetical protein
MLGRRPGEVATIALDELLSSQVKASNAARAQWREDGVEVKIVNEC